MWRRPRHGRGITGGLHRKISTAPKSEKGMKRVKFYSTQPKKPGGRQVMPKVPYLDSRGQGCGIPCQQVLRVKLFPGLRQAHDVTQPHLSTRAIKTVERSTKKSPARLIEPKSNHHFETPHLTGLRDNHGKRIHPRIVARQNCLLNEEERGTQAERLARRSPLAPRTSGRRSPRSYQR